MAARELPNGQGGRRPHDRRNDRCQAAPVRELRVQDGVVFVQLLPELIGYHFEAGAQLAGVERNALFAAHDAVTLRLLVPPLMNPLRE